jgi:hypothetical protein
VGTNDDSTLYLGHANDDVYVDGIMPSLTDEHGAYFDGDDRMEFPKDGEITFTKDFTAELYIRFSQETVDKEWYVF